MIGGRPRVEPPGEARQYWVDRVRSLRASPLPFWPAPVGTPPPSVEVTTPSEVARKLEALTRGAPLLRHAAVVAAVQVVLARHAGVTEAVVGSPPRADKDEPVAANVLPILQSLPDDLRFGVLLSEVRRSLLDAFALQAFPCRPVLEELHPGGSPVKVAVALEGFTGDLDGIPEVLVRANVSSTRIRLVLDGNRGVGGDALQVFGRNVGRVLAPGLDDYSVALTAIDLLAEDRLRVVQEWNRTAAPGPARSVVARFEEHAARRPEARALVGDETCTYGELNAAANRLAEHLRGRGVGREVRVATFLRKPEAIITAMLGVLKAGGAYVALDPSYPTARIAAVLGDADASLIVTDSTSAPELPARGTPVVLMEEQASGRDPGNPGEPLDPAQLAYVVYTSGSTGEPKGVMVAHGSLANAIEYFVRRTGVDERSRVSQLCSFSFDASALECYVALTSGATLCVAPVAARASGPALGAFFSRERVTAIGAITPSVLALVDPEDAATVEAISIGAEKCPADLADRWSEGRLLLNCYGPTEATIDCICGPCPGGEGDPPLGKPITNARAYVLDAQGRPAPLGVVGELYVGGVPVARGYARRPAETAVAFVPDPFGQEPGGRLYRTGDLARFRPDGRLDFCGRVDRQVKVDGVRIELGEIESALRSHPSVSQAVVDVEGDAPGQQKLTAYVVPRHGPVPAGTLRDHLRALLPSTMVPSEFVELDHFDVTSNGKIDRRRLPKRRPAHGDAAPAAGDSEIERTLAAIWEEVLGIDSIGPDDDFFELGGRSLQVTRITSKVAKAFSVQLPLETMFESPTLAGLAAAVRAAAADDRSAPEPLRAVARPPLLPLSFSQQRLWFLHQVLPRESASLYNGPVPVRLRGSLDGDALQRSFDEIIRRHEVLRTAFRVVDGQPCQVILPELELRIETVALAGDRATQVAEVDALAAADAGEPFDLARPPLLRARLLELDATDHVLLLNIHHIVFDGWSVGVLLSELSQLYGAFVQGDPSPLPPLPLQYADFALWQRRTLVGRRLDEQLSYWRNQLAGAPDLELPADGPRPALPTYRGAIHSFRISRALTDRLSTLARADDVTLFMALFAGFCALLHRYTGQDDLVISSPVANRAHVDLEGLIGFFVNSLVLRVDLSGNPTFHEVLRRVRRVTLGAYDHQDVPFERLVEELRPERMATHNPLFRAAFSLQNTPAPPVGLPGLVVSPWETHNRTAKFDLVMAMTDTGNGLAADVEYSSDLFTPDTIHSFVELYCEVLESAVEDPDRTLLDLPLGSPPGVSVGAHPLPTFTF